MAVEIAYRRERNMQETQAYLQLERAWAEFNELDPKGMVVCSSGTAALHLALEAMQFPVGSQVVLPDYTQIACARAVSMAGLVPVFLDCGQDLLLDPRRLTCPNSAVAIMLVHIYGRVVSEDVKSEGMVVIEDLAEAHGIRPRKEAHAACWSFYRNKIVAGEEGGAVWFADNLKARLARSLRDMGFNQSKRDYWHIPRGHNYRLANTLASLVLTSISHYPTHITKRWATIDALDSACPRDWRMPKRQAPWVYDLRIRGMVGEEQWEVVEGINREFPGLARCGFRSTTLQPEYLDVVADVPESRKATTEVVVLDLRVAESIINQGNGRAVFDQIKDRSC